MSSIKQNIIYSSLLTVSNYLFPLITYPYVSRVLGVDGIGICNFIDSVIQYCILFSMMGTMTLGIREIARTKDNNNKLNTAFSSILTLNLVFTIISIIALILCIKFLGNLDQEKYESLFIIGVAKIISTSLQIEWLFKGLEDFRYVTIRAIIVRILYVVSVFIFVHEKNDYVIYFALTTSTITINAIINLIYSRHFIKFRLKGLEIKKYFKPFLTLGSYLFLTSLYTTFNVAYLGLVTNTIEVGYYTTATKLYTIIMSLFTAFTGVMLPRISNLMAKGEQTRVFELISKSLEVLFLMTVPLIAISEVCAPEIISLLAGSGYEGAEVPMRIVMPLMLVIGYEQIIIVQLLTPLGKDRFIFTNSVIGALVGLSMNLLVVSKLASIGSAIVWLSSEFAVLISSQYFTTKCTGYRLPVKGFIHRLLLLIVLIIVLAIVKSYINNSIASLFTISILSSVFCIAIEWLVFRNSIVESLIRKYLLRL